MDLLVKCMICNRLMKHVNNSHLNSHKLNMIEYKKMFPYAETISLGTRNKHSISLQGKILSEEIRKKISKKHIGKVIPIGTREKISAALKGKKFSNEAIERRKIYYKIYGHPSKGRKLSGETKKKIGEASIGRVPWNKGKIWSNEVKEKISKKLKENKISLETRKKMSLSQRGRKHKLSSRLKISLARKGMKLSNNTKLKILESLNRSPNNFEKKCIKLFQEHNLPLKFVGGFDNKDFFIAGKVPDFVATNGKKVLIEVFYEYFKIREYGSIESYKRTRMEAFNKYGWKTLFFTYKDINLNFDQCLQIIKEELN